MHSGIARARKESDVTSDIRSKRRLTPEMQLAIMFSRYKPNHELGCRQITIDSLVRREIAYRDPKWHHRAFLTDHGKQVLARLVILDQKRREKLEAAS